MMLCFMESDSFKLVARIVFLGSQLFIKILIERMMAHQMQMPSKIWSRLNLMWGIYLWLLVLLTYMLCIITQLLIGLT